MTCFESIQPFPAIFVSVGNDSLISQEKRTKDGFLIEAFRKIDGGVLRFAGRKFTHDILKNFEGFYIKVRWNNPLEMKAIISDAGVELIEMER